MALAVIKRAGDDRHRAVLVEADLALLLHRGRGAFEEIADPPPAQPAMRLALSLTGREAVPIRSLERLLQHGSEVAAVVDGAGRRLEGEDIRLDVVDAAQLDGAAAGLL